jgi:ABC-type uncharacterized transport system ATPase subunit
VLEAHGLVKRFGGVVAVDDVSLRIEPGEIRCLVGPNGAGKTTVFNLLAGATQPTAGRIRLAGRDITGLGPRRISRLGVSRKYQAPATFELFSVRDNLRVAVDGKRRFHQPLARDRRTEGRVDALLDELDIRHLDAALAGHLAHGERQWLEIGMVLANDPSVLLLDEPTAGMSAKETDATETLIRRVSRARDLTTVVIEHDVEFVRHLADRITVLHNGHILVEGDVATVVAHPEVRRVYLGEV